MTDHDYILEPYDGPSTRHKCPRCGEKGQFAKYVHFDTGLPLADHVGKCNRINKCDYHLPPKEFFAQNPNAKVSRKTPLIKKDTPTLPPFQHSFGLVEKSLNPKYENHFLSFLISLFGATIAESLKHKYFIGTSFSKWANATVFWRVSINEEVRAGKVILYDKSTGKRCKDLEATWIHARLGLKKPDNFLQSFFGEHLLNQFPESPVAIVESEKTAIIGSVYAPNLIWLATGGKTGCKWRQFEVCKVLAGRNVILYPDKGCYGDWTKVAEHIQSMVNCKISVSSFLERKDDVALGADLADYFVKRDPEAGWAITEYGYPVMWDVKINDIDHALGNVFTYNKISN